MTFQPGDIVVLAATPTRPTLRHRVITCQPVQGAVLVEVIHSICVEEGEFFGTHDYRCSSEATLAADPRKFTFYRDFGSPENKAAGGKWDIFALVGSWEGDTAETIASLDGQTFTGGWRITRQDLATNCTLITEAEAAHLVPESLWKRLRLA